MRFLLTERAALSLNRYQRFQRRSQLDALFPDHLVAGEPYLALNGLVLPAGDAALLRRLTDVFVSICQKAATELAGGVPDLVDLGFPWAAAELLAVERPRLPLVGRFDFLRDHDGRWWLLEFNADTPSGIREAIAIDAMVHRELGEGAVRSNVGLEDRLVKAFESRVGNERLGLVTDAGELEDLAQMAFTQRLLEHAGMDAVLADIDNIVLRRGRIHLLGRPVAALYRYVPFESMFGTAPFVAIYDAVLSDRVRLLNGLFGLLLQHKGLLAWIWAHRAGPQFTPEEQQAIERHLPPTWRIDEMPPGGDPKELVVKQVFGREGEEVFFAEVLDDQAWAALEKRRTYIVQQRVHPSAQQALVPGLDSLEVREGFPTVGCFAIDGRWAGYYTRFGGPITDNRAKWVATFEERGTHGI